MKMVNFFQVNKKTVVSSGIVLVLFLVVVITGSTVVSHEAAEAGESSASGSSSESFNVEDYVENSWESEVLPFFEENQKDIGELLTRIEQDGLKTAGDSDGIDNKNGSWNFVVNGKGKILSVNTESRQGTAEVDVDPYDGQADMTMQIGPVINGYAIRDTLDFVKFDDFSNQIEWSKLGSGYNTKSFQNLENVQIEEGKELTITGVLVAKESENILTPVLVQE